MPRKKLPWGLGARRDPPDSRDLEYVGAPLGIALPVLPDVIDNRHLCPSHVFDQGREPCCVGCAGASDMSSRYTELLGRPVLLSARKAQWGALTHDQWPGEKTPGTSIRGLLSGLKAEGDCPEELWPLVEWGDDSNKHLCADYMALFYMLSSYSRLLDLDQLDNAIYEHGYALATIDVHTGWAKPTAEHIIRYRRNYTMQGLHAIRIIGRDRPRGTHKILNSWSDVWGDLGSADITDEDLEMHVVDMWLTSLEPVEGNNNG